MANSHAINPMTTAVRSITGEDGQAWLNLDDLLHWQEAGPQANDALLSGLQTYKAVPASDTNAEMAEYQDSLASYLKSVSATRWAREMTAPSAAVILDTETTGLGDRRRKPRVIQVAVIDAHTGHTLLDTLVNPGADAEIEPGASAVHGLTMDKLTGAPSWGEVLPQVLTVTEGRKTLAYRAKYDRRAVTDDSTRCDLDPMHLADEATWGCLMQRRSDWLRIADQLALAGDHSALGDCQAARALLLDMTQLR